jgi:hypothetical protein
MIRKGWGMLLTVLLVAAVSVPCSGHEYTIADDFSFPGYRDYDYGLHVKDIQFSDQNPSVGETVDVTATIHNYGLAKAASAWGWYSPDGRSCWGEWDFYYPTTRFVDITYRCNDWNATVQWRVELDGEHLVSLEVPETGGTHWKLVTVHDVLVTEGWHTVFLGTYQMDYHPDYHVDWVRVGDVHIEAEDYDRMGGNDPNPDLQGLYVYPKDIPIQIWDGHPYSRGTMLCEGFVGDIATVIDHHHDHPGGTYEARYLRSNGEGNLTCEWTPTEPGPHFIYVLVDPEEAMTEIDERNNLVRSFAVVSGLIGKSVVDPDTMYATYSNALDPVEAVVYLGNISDDHTVSEIETSTLMINESIIPTSTCVLPSHHNFTGEVMEIAFDARELVSGYGVMWDTTCQPITVGCELTDDQPVWASADFVLVGHRPGDVNGSGVVDIDDVVLLVEFIFAGGEAPEPYELGDIQCSGSVDIDDVVHLIDFIFAGGNAPCDVDGDGQVDCYSGM